MGCLCEENLKKALYSSSIFIVPPTLVWASSHPAANERKMFQHEGTLAEKKNEGITLASVYLEHQNDNLSEQPVLEVFVVLLLLERLTTEGTCAGRRENT